MTRVGSLVEASGKGFLAERPAGGSCSPLPSWRLPVTASLRHIPCDHEQSQPEDKADRTGQAVQER